MEFCEAENEVDGANSDWEVCRSFVELENKWFFSWRKVALDEKVEFAPLRPPESVGRWVPLEG
jgi:hypothetical protein